MWIRCFNLSQKRQTLSAEFKNNDLGITFTGSSGRTAPVNGY